MSTYIPIWVALVAAIAPILAVVLSHRRSGKKIEQIHVLVNSRLTQALDEIDTLKDIVSAKDAVIADQAEINRTNT